MNPTFLVLLGFLAGGGSGDLLDYVPTDSYWQNLSVQVTVDAMEHEAAPDPPVDATNLIADLGAADPQTRDAASDKILKLGPAVLPQIVTAAGTDVPEVAERAQALIIRLQAMRKPRAVRRLMAIRALGELKDPKALPFLRAKLTDDEMFVPDYARAAIGRIDGHPTTQPSTAAACDDVWLLPANCAAVAQIAPRAQEPIDLEQALAKAPLRADQDPRRLSHDFGTLALSIAEQFGDVRLDALNIGISDDMDGDHGFVVIIASGQFDSANARQVLRRDRVAMNGVDGLNVFQPDGDSAMIIPSDHRLVLMASPLQDKLPIKEMIAAVKTNDPALRKSEAMSKLINSIPPPAAGGTRGLWTAIKVTDSYRQLPGLDGLQSLALWGDESGGSLQISGRGQSTDAETAHAAAEALGRVVTEGIALLKVAEPSAPTASAGEAFLGTVKFQSNANLVTGSGTITESPATFLMIPLLVGDSSNLLSRGPAH